MYIFKLNINQVKPNLYDIRLNYKNVLFFYLNLKIINILDIRKMRIIYQYINKKPPQIEVVFYY